MKIPTIIVTGYLGSGKTTFLKQFIARTNKKIAILMNEFGEISVDARVIEGRNIQMRELLGGCVCCSLQGDFEAAIKEIIETVNPELIVVETTGIAEPDALVFDIEDNLPELRLEAIITIVDCFELLKYPKLGYTGRIQIEMADIILLNKIDMLSQEQLQEAELRVGEINKTAVFFKTVRGDVDIAALLEGATEKSRYIKMHPHIEEEHFETFSFVGNRLDKEKFDAFIKSLHSGFYRIKGFVLLDKGYLFNFIAGRFNFESFETDKTELSFIGKEILRFKEETILKLKACEI